jgi:uncharacterized protein YndB with AHSA1/START domain
MTPDLVVRTTIEASAQEVFPYLVQSDLLVRWLGTWVDVDPQHGGLCAVDMGETQVRGSYVTVDPPRRVVFTWGSRETSYCRQDRVLPRLWCGPRVTPPSSS